MAMAMVMANDGPSGRALAATAATGTPPGLIA
jgi:hypothetical protein